MRMKFLVVGQTLRCVSQTNIASGTSNYIGADFDFKTEDWLNLTKWANFVGEDGEIHRFCLVNDSISESATGGLNLTSGSWSCYVYGNEIISGEIVTRVTTTAAHFLVNEVYENTEIKTMPTEFEVLIAEAEGLRNESQSIRNETEVLKNEANSSKEAIRAMSATASVDSSVGVPSVVVTKSTISSHENLDFAFHNISGPSGPQGNPGVSPSVSIEDIAGGTRVTIYDASHPEGQSFSVMDGDGTSNFNELFNRPTYNGSTVTGSTAIPEVKTAVWDAKADPSSIPTKTSDLQNDSGFLTSHQSLSAYRTASDQDVIDNGKASSSSLSAHTGSTSNPHSVTSEQTSYNSSNQHVSGSAAKAINDLESVLTFKSANTSDEGKFAKIKTVTNNKISEWEFVDGSAIDDSSTSLTTTWSSSKIDGIIGNIEVTLQAIRGVG